MVASATRSPPAAKLPCEALCAAQARLDWAKGGPCGGRAAVRCAHAQKGGGGVLSMAKGTALFDAVAISDTEAGVRKGAGRRCEPGRFLRGRVRADGMRGRLQ
jgi:hypothetical protein